ncbi:MAG: septum formation initiator family protein [Deltaproteobacteria bacterium]|nr:septum formation initiator family protein [Deltaproteobacteria bacterium]
MPRYRVLRAELAALQEQNRSYREEVRQLEVRVRALRTDPEAIERVARDELGMIRQDELVFQFDR